MIGTHMLIENDRPAQVITVPENYRHQFDARHGDTVIVIMEPRPIRELINTCEDMGGELIYNPYTIIWTCEKVDF